MTRTEDFSLFESGTTDLDINGLLAGGKWVPSSGQQTLVLTYSFPQNYNYEYSDFVPGFRGVSTNTQEAFLQAVRQLETITNITFRQVADDDNPAIRIGFTAFDRPAGLGLSAGWAYYPSRLVQSDGKAGDIWLSANLVSESSPTLTHLVFHEFGHALGLKHPHDHPHENLGGFPLLEDGKDGFNYTVMSYTDRSGSAFDGYSGDLRPQTFMALDIKALQHLYGRDMVTTGDSDTYSYDVEERYYQTIWDAGGVDAFEVTGTANVDIDLRPGTWSDVGTVITYTNVGGPERIVEKTVFITEDTVIENAVGGAGDDKLRGNDVGNRLDGGAGDDTLMGGEGLDSLDGGAGLDTADFSDLTVDIDFDLANDTAIYKDGEIETIASIENIVGSDGANMILGDTENNLLDGAGGDDTLTGGAGDDTLMGGEGLDSLDGGAGLDTADFSDLTVDIDFDLANDTAIYKDGEIETIASIENIVGSDGANMILGDAENNLLDGAAGDDTLTGGAGADVFRITEGAGSDIILDFVKDEDRLEFTGGVFAGFQAVREAGQRGFR